MLEQLRKYPAEPRIKPSSDKKVGITVQIDIDDTAIDTLIEKVNRLIKLLKEVQQIIKSLAEKMKEGENNGTKIGSEEDVDIKETVEETREKNS